MWEEMSYNKYNYNDIFRLNELYNNDIDNISRLLINIDDIELTIKNLKNIINEIN